jgi:hypothetical protein
MLTVKCLAGEGGVTERLNWIKVHYMHVWKYQKRNSFVQLIYTNKKRENK